MFASNNKQTFLPIYVCVHECVCMCVCVYALLLVKQMTTANIYCSTLCLNVCRLVASCQLWVFLCMPQRCCCYCYCYSAVILLFYCCCCLLLAAAVIAMPAFATSKAAAASYCRCLLATLCCTQLCAHICKFL